MKRMMVSIVFVMIVIGVSTYSYMKSEAKTEFNDLTMANIEALANGEIPDGTDCATYYTERFCLTVEFNGGKFHTYHRF